MVPGGSRTLLSSLLQRQCAKWGGLNSSAGCYGRAVTWLEVEVRGGGIGVPLIKSELRRITEALCSCRGRWELPSQLIYGRSSKT